MAVSLESLREARVAELKERLAAQGYRVLDGPNEYPDELRDIAPDIVAKLGPATLVMHLYDPQLPAERNRLIRLYNVAHAIPNTKLRIMLLDPEPGPVASRHAVLPPPYELLARLDHVEELLRRNSGCNLTDAAFLQAWSVAEGLLRHAVEALGEEQRRRDVGSILGTADSAGMIPDGWFEFLLEARGMRDSLVHGFTDERVNAEVVRRLIEAARALAAHLETSAQAH